MIPKQGEICLLLPGRTIVPVSQFQENLGIHDAQASLTSGIDSFLFSGLYLCHGRYLRLSSSCSLHPCQFYN